jgi:hypothetical protein
VVTDEVLGGPAAFQGSSNLRYDRVTPFHMIAAAVADFDVSSEDTCQQFPITFIDCLCVADGHVYYARSFVHDASIPQHFENSPN